VINDGAESAMFKQLFQRWMEKDETQGLGKVYTIGKTGEFVFRDTVCPVFDSAVHDKLQSQGSTIHIGCPLSSAL